MFAKWGVSHISVEDDEDMGDDDPNTQAADDLNIKDEGMLKIDDVYFCKDYLRCGETLSWANCPNCLAYCTKETGDCEKVYCIGCRCSFSFNNGDLIPQTGDIITKLCESYGFILDRNKALTRLFSNDIHSLNITRAVLAGCEFRNVEGLYVYQNLQIVFDKLFKEYFSILCSAEEELKRYMVFCTKILNLILKGSAATNISVPRCPKLSSLHTFDMSKKVETFNSYITKYDNMLPTNIRVPRITQGQLNKS